jgi:TIR domain
LAQEAVQGGWNLKDMIASLRAITPREGVAFGIFLVAYLALCWRLSKSLRLFAWALPVAAIMIAPTVMLALLAWGGVDRDVTPFRIYSIAVLITILGTALIHIMGRFSWGENPSVKLSVGVTLILVCLGWLLDDVFRFSHMGLGAPLTIGMIQAGLFAAWYFWLLPRAQSTKNVQDGAFTTDQHAKVAIPLNTASPESTFDTQLPTNKSSSKSTIAPVPEVTSDQVSKFAPVFISYRRDDSADIVGRIYDRMVSSFGAEGVFKDVDSIPLGVDFRKHLTEAVSRCGVVIAVIGTDWLAGDVQGQRRIDRDDDFVRIEVEAALARGIPVVPVTVRGVKMPERSVLPLTLIGLADRNGMAVRPDPDFHRDMDRLIASLKAHLSNALS